MWSFMAGAVFSELITLEHMAVLHSFLWPHNIPLGFPGGSVAKESCLQCRSCRRRGFAPWVGEVRWRRKWQPTPVFCLENPMDRGAWRATVHGVAKSRIRPKWFPTILHYVDRSRLIYPSVYPSIHQWAFGLFFLMNEQRADCCCECFVWKVLDRHIF